MEPEEGQYEDVAGVVVGTDIDETEAGSGEQTNEGVQIGPGAAEVQEQLADENAGLELGDFIEIHSNRADIETVRGHIYYIDETRISILEDGKSRKLLVLDMEKNEEGEIEFLPEYELTAIDILEKRLLSSFVAQRGMAKDALVETFTAEGDPLATYKLVTVDEVTDTAVLEDTAGETLTLSFEFKGIPKDRSVAPFDVLRVIEAPKEEAAVPNEAAPAEVVEEFLDFEFLDEMEAPDFIPGLFQGTQKAAWLLTYDDDEQINDMLRERIRELDPAAQRSAKRIREVTRLVWSMLYLRNSVTSYRGTQAIGQKSAAFTTLVELLEKTEFPLAKKILEVAKAVYLDHREEDLEAHERGNTVDPTTVPDPAIRLHYLQDTIIKSIRYLDSQLKEGLLEAEAPNAGLVKKIPRWITIWQGYYNRYFMVIAPIREDGALKEIKFDSDFFRQEIPATEEVAETLSGLIDLEATRDKLIDTSYLGKVKMSYMRALGPRFGRYGEGGLTHKIEEADQSEIKGYLLFPLQTIRDLGYTRSGILVLDVANGMKAPKTMSMILHDTNIVDIPEAGKIISVSFDGSTLGNTEITDWLKGQAIYGGGIGDLMPYLRSFGLLEAEFTLAQKNVLDTKVGIYRAAVRKLLKEARDTIQAKRAERKPIQTFPLLTQQRAYEMFLTITRDSTGETILKQLLEDFAVRHPAWAKDDIARFAYLYAYYPDLLINTLAQNPEVAKERLRAERDIFIREVLNKLEEDRKLEDAGQPPVINPCQHVKDLNQIRRIPDLNERMLSLNKFIRLYKLKKEDHWLWCNNGEPPHHLICEHEYLLLQEFLRPKEREVIHKELLLVFGGGKFNGQYICRQCGQPIAEFDYDNHLEYTDGGVPMAGRDVLVDEDAIEEEKLERAVTAEAEDEERVETRTEDEMKIYRVITELADLVGIFPDRKSYQTMIIRVKNALALVPDRGKYAQSQRVLKKAGKASTDYEVFISRILVSLCAGALLIDVQTHVPEYIVRYTLPGCMAPEFTGYPMDPDRTKPDTGMEYLACAISSITKRVQPWDLTGYQSISSTPTRIKEIMTFLKSFTKQLAETPDVQQAILDKKQYLIETFGYESARGRPSDLIPYGFTPAPFIPTKELAAEAESPVVIESASDSEKVRAYIKQAHIYALKYGKYAAGMGFSETACCYTGLSQPGEFWRTKGNLPELPPPEPPKGPLGSRLYVHMAPRALEKLFGKADASIMYRLFLRVCFRGPRLGEQHEPGYDMKCPWCDFQFAEDPRLPPPTKRYSKDDKKQKKFDEEYQSAIEGNRTKDIAALREAGIEDITTESFEELLNDVHRKSLIPPVEPPMIPTPIQNLRGMLSVLPPPFEDYEETLRQVIVALEGLPPNASRVEVINALGPLSTKAVSLESEIQSRLGNANFGVYTSLVKLPPQELGEALRSYFLIPFQRILTTASMGPREFKPIIKPSRTTDFSDDVFDDLKEAYSRHTSYLNEIVKDVPKTNTFVRAKIQEVVDRLSVVIPLFIKVLRPTVLRGGNNTATFLQRCLVAGMFAEFIMPNHIPSNASGVVAPTSTISNPARLPAKILQSCLLKYNDEGLKYSEEQIREMIQDRIEKEKAKIMRDKNDMTPEQRKLDNMLQRLGMGKWAVGGTKAIWRYDPNQYVSEKEAMEAAGITRFGPQVDFYEAEGGYDVVQTTDDNA
jgi:hypothetical protein